MSDNKYDAPDIMQMLATEGTLEAMEATGLTFGEDNEVIVPELVKPETTQAAELRETTNKVRQTHARRTLKTREIFDEVTSRFGDPLMALAEIGFNVANDPSIRINALKELASYGHSKLKTIEHTGADGAPLEFKMTVVNQILELIDKNVAN